LRDEATPLDVTGAPPRRKLLVLSGCRPKTFCRGCRRVSPSGASSASTVDRVQRPICSPTLPIYRQSTAARPMPCGQPLHRASLSSRGDKALEEVAPHPCR
jgi:hypothetical protein